MTRVSTKSPRKTRHATPPRPLSEEAQRVDRALRVALGVVIPRMSRSADAGRLGFSRPASARAVAHSQEYMAQLAEETGEWWFTLVLKAAQSSESDWRRVERDHLEDACTGLADAVRSLPRPWREVVIRRSTGMSWRDIVKDLPHRVEFSLRDDYMAALRVLDRAAGAEIRRIA